MRVSKAASQTSILPIAFRSKLESYRDLSKKEDYREDHSTKKVMKMRITENMLENNCSFILIATCFCKQRVLSWWKWSIRRLKWHCNCWKRCCCFKFLSVASGLDVWKICSSAVFLTILRKFTKLDSGKAYEWKKAFSLSSKREEVHREKNSWFGYEYVCLWTFGTNFLPVSGFHSHRAAFALDVIKAHLKNFFQCTHYASKILLYH